MWKILIKIFGGVLVSMYYFPFASTLLPQGINTKMVLAILGLVLFGLDFIKCGKPKVTKSLINMSIIAAVVSIVAIISMTFNNTPDDTYATYFISMWVWLSAAYAVCRIIRFLHGGLTIDLLTNYLMGVCLFQCVIALIIDAYPIVKSFVNSFIIQGQDFLDMPGVERLYGIGANLDVAGIRFSLVLVLIIHSLINSKSSTVSILIKVLSYVIILVVGNMIARTTTVGGIISFLYLIYGTRLLSFNLSKIHKKVWKLLILIMICAIPYLVLRYNYDIEFARKIRFAFEGFFSIAESGRWHVGSNEQLKDMLLFPSNLKTWIIGDGYFANPKDIDPYYVGPLTGGFYMNTDSGYSRFIFYFGLPGLVSFAILIGMAARMCISYFTDSKSLFILFAIVNYLVWIKVATDCFLIFALFLVFGYINMLTFNEDSILHRRNI